MLNNQGPCPQEAYFLVGKDRELTRKQNNNNNNNNNNSKTRHEINLVIIAMKTIKEGKIDWSGGSFRKRVSGKASPDRCHLN